MHEPRGHVFHPGHQALHGITVVVDTADARTYVGRFDTHDEQGVNLLNVAVHEPSSSAQSRQEFLGQNVKFGVRVEHKHVCVPGGDVVRIKPLDEVSAE